MIKCKDDTGSNLKECFNVFYQYTAYESLLATVTIICKWKQLGIAIPN